MTLMFISYFTFSQGKELTLPANSQKSEVKQTIGLSTVEITYSSPAVKKRQIFGGLVPYGRVWRCGADKNTVIKLSHDAKINGKNISAGTYGVHMLPNEGDWEIIFSKNHTSWGSFTYKKEEDALRITVKPKTLTNNVEWLNYGFEGKDAEQTTAYLEWEKLKVPFTISFNVKSIVLQNMRNELRSLPGFGRVAHLQAARYCAQNNFNHEEALSWADIAVRAHPNKFAASIVKAELLRQTNKDAEAEKVMDGVIETASENDLNNYGYQLLQNKKIDKAIIIFSKNVKQNPKSWNAYDSLAEAYLEKGDKKNAKKNYKLAIAKKAPADQKVRIEKVLSKI